MNIVIKDKESVVSYKLEEIRDKIILGDCIKVMKKMPSESVDLVFIDPPYFLQLPKKKLIRWEVKTEVEGVTEEWDRFASFEEYDNFIRNILIEVKRLMKPNATVWVIGMYHNIFRIGKIMQDLGFWILNNVIWIKTNPMPNWLQVRFTNATEELIWAVKDKKVKKYTFNRQEARKYGNGKLGVNYWYIPTCIGKERLKDKSGKRLISTQKPEKLLERVILISSKEGDIVLDPVAGSGTTGYVAKKFNRHFIMIDNKEKYVKAMEERLKPLLEQRKFS
jgi:DNA modification methylase